MRRSAISRSRVLRCYRIPSFSPRYSHHAARSCLRSHVVATFRVRASAMRRGTLARVRFLERASTARMKLDVDWRYDWWRHRLFRPPNGRRWVSDDEAAIRRKTPAATTITCRRRGRWWRIPRGLGDWRHHGRRRSSKQSQWTTSTLRPTLCYALFPVSGNRADVIPSLSGDCSGRAPKFQAQYLRASEDLKAVETWSRLRICDFPNTPATSAPFPVYFGGNVWRCLLNAERKGARLRCPLMRCIRPTSPSSCEVESERHSGKLSGDDIMAWSAAVGIDSSSGLDGTEFNRHNAVLTSSARERRNISADDCRIRAMEAGGEELCLRRGDTPITRS